MGVPAMSVGIVFDEYLLGFESGVQVIWQNGEHCGYSRDEEPSFFYKTGKHVPLNYVFTNVIRLNDDYRNGKFTRYFEQAANEIISEVIGK